MSEGTAFLLTRIAELEQQRNKARSDASYQRLRAEQWHKRWQTANAQRSRASVVCGRCGITVAGRPQVAA